MPASHPDIITIVSGLPRSGTSLMMNMLRTAGMDLMVDGVRPPDQDNPKGYFEYDRVRYLKQDKSWLRHVGYRVVKIISPLLVDLPIDGSYRYRIIFMQRHVDEVIASQIAMLQRRGKCVPDGAGETMRHTLVTHLAEISDILKANTCFEAIDVRYNRLLADPSDEIARVNHFLGGQLNAAAMAEVIDGTLYHNRGRAGPDS